MKKLICTFLLVSLVLWSYPGCSKRNAAGRKAVSIMPGSWLHSQSATLYAGEKKKNPISKDERLVGVTKRVADRLIRQAEAFYTQFCSGFQWEVTLFDAPDTKNAYCMPGGKIGIYTGILPICENEAALAAVMGHEVAHALLTHGNERVTQQLGTSAMLQVADTAMESQEVAGSKRGKIMIALGLGARFGLVLPYSRKHEHEADRLGLELMARAGYDPAEAAALWRRMGAGGGGLPEFFSTHPSSDERVRRLTELRVEFQPHYDGASPKYGTGERL